MTITPSDSGASATEGLLAPPGERHNIGHFAPLLLGMKWITSLHRTHLLLCPIKTRLALLRCTLIIIPIITLISGCATGSAIVTGTKHPPISPDAVHLYSRPPETKHEEIALISANSYWSWAWNEQTKMDTATRDLRSKAANLGANGIILNGIRSEPISTAGMNVGGGFYGSSINSMRTIDGMAIYVP